MRYINLLLTLTFDIRHKESTFPDAIWTGRADCRLNFFPGVYWSPLHPGSLCAFSWCSGLRWRRPITYVEAISWADFAPMTWHVLHALATFYTFAVAVVCIMCSLPLDRIFIAGIQLQQQASLPFHCGTRVNNVRHVVTLLIAAVRITVWSLCVINTITHHFRCASQEGLCAVQKQFNRDRRQNYLSSRTISTTRSSRLTVADHWCHYWLHITLQKHA